MISPSSLKAKVRNYARTKEITPAIVWQNFMFERFLERVASSIYRDKLVLKGGALIGAIVGLQLRSTMDLDFTIKQYPLDEVLLTTAIKEICTVHIDDGFSFDLRGSKQIRRDAEYGGYNVMLDAKSTSGNLRFYLPIDITTGDVITPNSIQRKFPCMMDENKHIYVWSYNVETVLAEKTHAILQHGTANSRARDFYDIYLLTKTQKYDKDIFQKALEATIKQRNAVEKLNSAISILEQIEDNEEINSHWKNYRTGHSYAIGISFKTIMEQIKNVIAELGIGRPSQQKEVKTPSGTLYPAQPGRVYNGEIIVIQDDQVIQETSPGVVVEHRGIAASMRQDDIGQRFTIAYDREGHVQIKARREVRDREKGLER